MAEKQTTPQNGGVFSCASASAPEEIVETRELNSCNGRWRFPSHFDAENRPPAIRWLVYNLIPMNAVVLLYGESYSGKTGLAIHLLRCVALGIPFFGMATLRMPVVYIALENGDDADAHLRAVQAHERAHVSTWTWPDTVAFSDRAVDFTSSADVIHLVQDVTRIAPNGAMIVVDALLDGIGAGNIVLNELMNPVMKRFHELVKKCCGPVIVLHHANRTEDHTPLGATCILSRSDVHIKVEARTHGSAWKAEKVKGAGKLDWHPFSFQRVVLGINSDGQEMASCVLVEGATKTKASTAQKSSAASAVHSKTVTTPASSEDAPAPAQTFQGWRSLPTA